MMAKKKKGIKVASSTHTGPADYYCDGVDDQIEINAAIDEMEKITARQWRNRIIDAFKRLKACVSPASSTGGQG